ncbi:MAG: Omp28-related outer membrane protein [Flavobacteriales bacterium]|nr:Omp28-related outer membrane protein [Flavobacteriales bacterium]
MRHTTLRTLLFCTGLATAGMAPAQDLFIGTVVMPRYIKANVGQPVTAHIRNNGPGSVSSFTLRWRLNDGAWNSQPFNIGGGGLPAGGAQGVYVPATHQTLLNAPAGIHTVELNVQSANDPLEDNNTKTLNVTAMDAWADKIVLFEGRTETWCPFCPDANIVTNALAADPAYAVVKFHIDGELSACDDCATYFSRYTDAFTPVGMIEMGEYGTYTPNADHSAWEGELAARSENAITPAELTMASSVDRATRQLSATLGTRFTHTIGGPFRINVYVAEDDVPGPQTNAPANYRHNGVMRAMLGGPDGTASVVPNDPVVGTAYAHTYTWTVPSGYDIDRLRLVGVLEHRPGSGIEGRCTINAVNGRATVVGINEVSMVHHLSVHPNPFHEQLYVRMNGLSGNASVELTGMDGRIAYEGSTVLNGETSTAIRFDDATIPHGAYLLRIRTAEGVAVQRVVKMR